MSQPGNTSFDAKDGIVAAALAVLGGLHLAVWLGSALATLAAGHGWQPVAGSRLTTLLLGWPAHLSDPRLAFDPQQRTLLPSPVTLWACQLLALLLLVTIAGLLIQLARRATSPIASHGDATGWASSKQIRQQLGETSVRRRAVTTRPSVSSQRRYPTRQVGLALGTDLRP